MTMSDEAPGMQPDHKLIFDIQYLSCAESVHTIENLVGAYRTAVQIYNETGDRSFLDLSIESERSLRVLLTELRLKKSVEYDWDRFLIKS